MARQRIAVTVTVAAGDETQTAEIPPGGYILVCDEGRHIAGERRYANGTIVITTKRTEGQSDALSAASGNPETGEV